MTPILEGDGSGTGHGWYKKLLEYVIDSFKNAWKDRLVTGRMWKKVSISVENAEEEIRRDPGNMERRYFSSRRSMMEDVEGNAETVWIARNRALLDLRLGQFFAAMRVWSNARRDKMLMPKTGGRWLLTTKRCPVKKLHINVEVRGGTGGSERC